MPIGTIAAALPAAGAAVYRPRRPARTLLHKVMRENLETYLEGGDRTGDFDAHVPFHVEAAYRRYLNCGILAHGFARAYCAGCGHDFLIAFILEPPVIERILLHVGEARRGACGYACAGTTTNGAGVVARECAARWLGH